jgi:hypothetical protein
MTADQLAIVENGQCALKASGDQLRQTIFERILVGPKPVEKPADALPVSPGQQRQPGWASTPPDIKPVELHRRSQAARQQRRAQAAEG